MGGERKKVLWVDDEIEFLRSHIMFLETRGYSVIPVFSGDDAIELLHERPREFDIVLLDEQMPGKDGLTTLEEIKAFLPDLPVVMVTKSEEEHVMEDALGKKIDGYLTKPVNPSQILSVCKSLLHSKQIISNQVSTRFVRAFSQHRAALSRDLSAQDWLSLYRSLTMWDFELEQVEDEGVRQSHAGQKSDSNAAFAEFVIEHYPQWLRGESRPPRLSHNVLDEFVAPRIVAGENVVMVVLDCMRLDQYLSIEKLLRNYFEIERHGFFTILPSATRYARRSLLSGLLPDELAQRYPQILTEDDDSVYADAEFEKQLLKDYFARKNIKLSAKETLLATIANNADAQNVLNTLGKIEKCRMSTIVVNFVDLLTQSHTTSSLLRDIAPDESSFRALTYSWFQYSTLFQILRSLAQRNCTIVLTTDHGSMLCSRGTELYGTDAISPTVRYYAGKGLNSDERHVFYVSTPAQYRLPPVEENFTYLLAREKYYFVAPDNFENFQNQYQPSFYYGGISMEEMIVPLAVLRAR